MKLAVISDIHGNLEALDAVLSDCRTRAVDEIICLGDVVGYGADPSACLQRVTQDCALTLMGNHEYAALGLVSGQTMNAAARESMDWTQHQLDERDLAIISDLPLDGRRENLYFVHSSPDEPSKWRYILTSVEAEAAFRKFTGQICFVGHSHLPMIFVISPEGSLRQRIGHDFCPDEENRYVINVGSVGQPRDNDSRSCYVVYDSAEQTISYCRVSYNIELAQSKMAQARLPQLLIDRLLVGR
jgi:predicted phosphodiesterase